MSEPVISIIIPVYNVEPYLRRCLDSVIGQTYRNLEIIIVDDGSTDNCGAVCDEYKSKDERIRVIHKENGGLSSARNTGLDVATGGYVGFVDSDDWVEPDMMAYLLSGIHAHHAKISVCGRFIEYKKYSKQITWDKVTILDRDAALGQLFQNDKLQNNVWDKLFAREIFDDIRFPVGRTYEDIAVMHKLFMRADCVVCLPQAKYHYLQRGDSIIGDISLENSINFYISAKSRYEEMKETYPQFERILAGQCAASAITIWSVYYANPREERKRYASAIQQISAFAAEHEDCVSEYIGLGKAGRIILRLVPHTTWWSFALAGFWGWLYKLRNGRAI